MMRRLLVSVSVLFLIAACEGPRAVQEDLPTPQFAEVTIVPDGPISFTGRTTFGAFVPVTGKWFQDPDDPWGQCPATAVLEFGEGRMITLTVMEGGVCGDRTTSFDGTLTPGGALKYNLPGYWVPFIMEHTGCTPSGTFPAYHGHFDGEFLSASAHMNGLCDGGNLWSTYPNWPDVRGPLKVTFGIELQIDG